MENENISQEVNQLFTTPPPTPSKKSYLMPFLVVTIFLITGGLLFLGYQNYQLQQQINLFLISQKTSNEKNTITSVPTKNDVDSELTFQNVNNRIDCSSSYLNISFSIPNNWKCIDENQSLTLSNENITIILSDLGRGPYCWNPDMPDLPTPDPKACVVTDYVKETSKYALSLFKSYNENKEVFGGIHLGKQPWISIQWAGMENNDLSQQEKNDLLIILNSVKELQ